ncbi:TPA: ead/Ea22-like family protein [Klebsiella quasipneumoniae subsp. quasipneumoniae]|nr:ead/Ea22-like family protein [Klebsiella quasipneumoniae subsp. quasipneumoniae]
MTTDITELAQRMKAAAEKATPGPWYVHDKPCEDGNYGIDTSDKEFLAEAVVWWGFARQSIWREEDAKYIALANPANILALVEALASEKRICATWSKTAKSTGEKLEKAQAINAAAEKLVRCKGRYHSEQNYRALAALFGVTTPDLPPLDSESSAVTVKLTDINEYLAEVNDKTLNRAFRLLAEGVRAGDVAAMRAAGIKVEDE